VTPPAWRKSSYSEGGTTAECVELARLGATIGIRDSKARAAGYLSISPAILGDLLGRIKKGRHDLA
jgi:hypothetical protein